MAKTQKLIERVFTHCENGDVDKAVFASLRLARKNADLYYKILFIKEIQPEKRQFESAALHELGHLDLDKINGYLEVVLEDWASSRETPHAISSDSDKKYISHSVGDLQNRIKTLESSLDDYVVPAGMTPIDTAAFKDEFNNKKANIRNLLAALSTVNERIRMRCFNYASRIEQQMLAQRKTVSFLMEVQNSVNSYFSTYSDDTYKKLKKAANLLDSKESEDHALLLTSIRRAIKSAADYYYPPVSNQVLCKDGKLRDMGNEQYLNRLHEYACVNVTSSSSQEMLAAELDYFMTFARKLNSIASKGVHSEVTASEAKQGLVGLYMLLYNLNEKTGEIH